MTELTPEVGSTVALQKPVFDKLVSLLQGMGYETVGPQIQNEVVGYGPISGLEDLPRGYSSEQSAGHYRLVYSGHPRYFDITPGAASWKQYLFPSRTDMFTVKKEGKAWKIKEAGQPAPMLAFMGVRPCELAAIHIQDRVFLRDDWSDPVYRTHRQGVFILSVNCLHPCGTCFCASMSSGPEAVSGYDLSFTELEDMFLAQIGSEAGRLVISGLPFQPASAFLLQTARRGLDEARKHMGRSIPAVEELPAFLLSHLEDPQWDDVAARCLSCTNCTQVCPTCFCWDAHDHPNLSGSVTRRERVWDSCFNPDYSYIAGGNTRPSTRSRYRQWMTHKLASWVHQFGVSGCVGCGRCITWCPAGIDITAEVAAMRKEAAA